MRRTWHALLGVLVIGACKGEQPPEPVVADLPDGIVARVGDESVSVDTVRRLMKVRGIEAKPALELALSDAVLAQGARSNDRFATLVAVAERAAVGRAMLEAFDREAKAAGPPTAQEVAAITERRWYEVARPASVRTVHAIIMAKEKADRDRAKRLAPALADTLRGAATAEEFEKRAKAFDARGLELKVEQLPPVAADGRVVPDQPPAPGDAPTRLELPYARAANELSEVAQQSPPVETVFGIHVIFAMERIAGFALPAQELAQRAAAEVYADRARAIERGLIDRLVVEAPVELDRAAADLTSRVSVAP